MTRELVVLIGDDEIGRVTRDRSQRPVFTYAERWRQSRHACPLSLSMPLARREHGHRTVDPFLWGLLPDNDIIVERWARRFQVSARNVMDLLAHVGEDCPGAVRFVRPDRLPELPAEGRGTVEWLDEAAVAARLRELSRDVSAWRRSDDVGQFSLAGAQPKTALLRDGKRWGLPSGRMATTHILKPGIAELDGFVLDEHFCLALAHALGLTTARSTVERFEDQVVVVVERYDRVRTPDGVLRVHQEDACQALGVPPSAKYQADGGPGPAAIAGVLRERAPAEDLHAFVDALAYSWLIAGTDGHAKNYSLLIGAGGRARLAPLYDLASVLPYHGADVRKQKLAMKIGGKYRLSEIGAHQWAKLGAEFRLDADAVRGRVLRLAEALPDASSSLRAELRLDAPLLDRLADALAVRATECARLLRG
jgi:serine/threonine-protein kinase HipA